MSIIGNYRTAEGEILDINNPENREWMEKHYPAVMANRPYGMSDAYQFMPTWKLAETLQNDFGMGIVEIGQQRSRKRNPAGQEHFLKFRLPKEDFKLTVGGSFPELVLFNSHNGRSTIRAYAGVFRMVCANGLIVSDQTFGKLNVKHIGETNNYSVFEQLLRDLATRFKSLDERIKVLSETVVNMRIQLQFARMLIDYRDAPKWVMPEMVIVHRREEDKPLNEKGDRDLWTTFNVIQENLTNADDISYPGDRANRIRPRHLRRLNGARAHILVNEKLWEGMEMYFRMERELRHLKIKPVEDPIVDLKPVEVVTPPAKPVVAEDQEPVQAGQETLVLRPFSELMELGSFAEMEAITDDEKAALSPEEKKKLSSRKSYLKRKG